MYNICIQKKFCFEDLYQFNLNLFIIDFYGFFVYVFFCNKKFGKKSLDYFECFKIVCNFVYCNLDIQEFDKVVYLIFICFY